MNKKFYDRTTIPSTIEHTLQMYASKNDITKDEALAHMLIKYLTDNATDIVFFSYKNQLQRNDISVNEVMYELAKREEKNQRTPYSMQNFIVDLVDKYA